VRLLLVQLVLLLVLLLVRLVRLQVLLMAQVPFAPVSSRCAQQR
jgi:hypothetical protein